MARKGARRGAAQTEREPDAEAELARELAELEAEEAALLAGRKGKGKGTGAGTKEEGPPAAPGTGQDRERVYRTDALHDQLEEIGWTATAPWEETQALTGAEAADEDDANVEDDLERELVFYGQALRAAKVAVGKFEEAGQRWARPDDYYAEMVKDDQHMKRVKAKLLLEKQRIDDAEERRKARESKRFAKHVQAEKLKERAQAKKAQIQSVEKWRKQRARNNYGGDGGDFDVDAEDDWGGARVAKQRTGVRFQAQGARSKKRQQRDEKFGYGGVKQKLKKQNDRASADAGEFRQGNFRAKFGAQKGKAGARRPGKSKRAARRGRQ